MDTRTSPARARIARLREVMNERGIDAVLVPSSDPHLSEYLPGRWQGREHFSGFTGSMGTLAVTATKAALFADSRYWTQAETQLQGSGIELVRIPTGTAAHHIDWLAARLDADLAHTGRTKDRLLAALGELPLRPGPGAAPRAGSRPRRG